MRPFKRADRVASLIQSMLSELLVHEVKDPSIGFVTVTAVKVAGDLRFARVFISAYGDEAQIEASLEGLRRASGYLQRAVGQRLNLRFVPELRFVRDELTEQERRISQLLHATARGEDVDSISTDLELAGVDVDLDRTSPLAAEPPAPPPPPKPRKKRRRR